MNNGDDERGGIEFRLCILGFAVQDLIRRYFQGLGDELHMSDRNSR